MRSLAGQPDVQPCFLPEGQPPQYLPPHRADGPAVSEALSLAMVRGLNALSSQQWSINIMMYRIYIILLI